MKIINNNKIFFFFLCFLGMCFSYLVAQEDAMSAKIDGIESDEYLHLVEDIIKVGPPKIIDRYVVFTATAKARHVAIAFEHEKYAKLHSFRRLIPDKEAGSVLLEPVLFFIMEIPEKTSFLKYRLVIDGLWTFDPENNTQEFDEDAKVTVSKLSFPPRRDIKTRVLTGRIVNFVYVGIPHQRVSVAGSFNNWDPFMYFLKETSEGIYELELALPHGTHVYSYFLGTQMEPDVTNPNHYYNEEGKKASVIKL